MEGNGKTGLFFSVLGPLEVRREDRQVALGGPKPRALVAALVLRHGSLVRTEALVDILWGERPPKTAHKTLQKYVSLLRKELGTALVTRPGGYALEVSCDQVDACRFEAMVRRAADRPAPEAAALLRKALVMWRDDPFPELADSADGLAERARLEEMGLGANESLAEAELDLGHHAGVVADLEQLVAQYPLRERSWGVLMLGLYRSGRQADALRAYQRLRTQLAEIGIEPSAQLQDLEDRILLQDPGLDLRPVTPTGGATNLPAQLTSFVGRERELGELGELIPKARLVTLIGPGGSGKTRLAIECAGRSRDDYDDGTWFVDLAPLTSPDEIAKAVADPLGLSGGPEQPVERVLVGHLATRRLQLVLDNCEHLVSGVAPLITRMLLTAPDLQILATSREPLGVEGETTFEVPPLPVPEGEDLEGVGATDAARLFVDRAQAVDPHFELSVENVAAVAEICRRLDGIPLALELAAARMRSFSPHDIAGLLGNRFSILTSPVRTVPARHQTLQAAVEWSYDLLSERERTLFKRLSVFRGGFDLESVREVCAGDPLDGSDMVVLLGELVDRSLVVADHRRRADRRRYRLLETLREYGRDRLDSAETTPLRDAHAAYFCKLAERAAPHLQGALQSEWLDRLILEYDNLRKALRWAFDQEQESGIRLAIALAFYWDAVGPRTEAQDWLARAAELTNSCCTDLFVPVRLAASDLFVSTEISHSVRYAEEALARARQTGDERSEAAALRALGWARGLEEDHETATALAEESLRIWRKLGDPWEIAWSLERFGQSDYRHPQDALERFEESLELYREAGDRRRAGMVLYKMAEAGVRAGVPLETTEAWVDESLQIFEEMGSIHDGAHALLELGKIRRRRGRPEAAREALDIGLQRMRMVGDRRCTARTLTALGLALIDGGHQDRARDVLVESLALGRELEERQNIRIALAGMARLALNEGLGREAAVLSAVADRIDDEFGGKVRRGSHRSEFLAAIRGALDPEEYETARKEGQAMTLGDAVALARSLSRPTRLA